MADYQFSIVGLTSPPQPAYLQSYRPALAVQNTGVKPLTFSGNFSVYARQAPGQLLFQTGFIPATVAAGASAVLLGETNWTPAAAGDYTVAAHVTTNRPNLYHDLGPMLLHVSGAEPPEPPIVTAHATQHETDGDDELNVTNLRGELFDPQSPVDHASRHQQGGTDELSVTGLHGTLADAQPVTAHGNEKHTTAFVDVNVLSQAIVGHNGQAAPHASATTIEFVARKGAASGYAPLDSDARLPLENAPLSLVNTIHAVNLPYITVGSGTTSTIFEKSLAAGELGLASILKSTGYFYFGSSLPVYPKLHYDSRTNGGAWSLDRAVVEVQKLIEPYPDLYLCRWIAKHFCYTELGSDKHAVLLHARSSADHGAIWGDNAGQPSGLLFLESDQIDIRVRLEVPAAPDASAFAFLMRSDRHNPAP